MRFEASIILKQEPLLIPTNYRISFMSLVKEAICFGNDDNEIYQKYYGDHRQNAQKPFTFSVQLPVKEKEKGRFILENNRIGFHFSSRDPVFLISVYNGLVNLKKDYPLFPRQKIEIRNIHLEKNMVIDSDEIVFKTYSPFIVRDIQDKKGKGFISFDHEDFEKNLFYSVENLCKNFISKDYELSREHAEILLVKCRADIISHYGGEIGTSGIIKIKAPAEVLQLVYDAGLGAKRSQGFGMLEVVG